MGSIILLETKRRCLQLLSVLANDAFAPATEASVITELTATVARRAYLHFPALLAVHAFVCRQVGIRGDRDCMDQQGGAGCDYQGYE